jgi:hypothetical protein
MLISFLWTACQASLIGDSPTRTFNTASVTAVLQQETPLIPFAANKELLPTLMITSGAGSTNDLSPGTTYYIRPDGGSANQCNGLADTPFSESVSPACAWNHPFWALPPQGSARMAGGDTLRIAPGQYRMGYGAPGATRCDAFSAYDCYMAPIPSGSDAAHPTRILGTGWESGCANPPQLWGAEHADRILNLDGSNNVDVACLEITDHSACVESQENGLPCERDNPPYGDWAAVGIFAADSANVRLSNLNIHGLANSGVHAGRLMDWTVEYVRIAGNGWSGWDGDIGEDGSNQGTLTFRRWLVEWNGCGETYPGGRPTRCWAQSAGGYGDGVGTGATGGHWIIEDSAFLHNTSDGLDLLYARLPGARVDVRRVIAEGNAGNQIKTTGPTHMENVIVVGNCNFFSGQPFAYRMDTNGDGTPDGDSVDPCRAGGDAISLDLNPGDQASVVNSTLTGEGTCLLIAMCAYQKDCLRSQQNVLLTNDIFEGNPSFSRSGEDVCFAWYNDEAGADRLPQNPFTTEYSILHAVPFGNVNPCGVGNNLCGTSAGLLSPGLDGFNAHLQAGSPAIDAGTAAGAPSSDFDGQPRDAKPDMGAYER